MKKYFIYPVTLISIFLLTYSLSAQEQEPLTDGLAGPDQHTCKVNGVTHGVKLGPKSGAYATSCYYWTPELGINNPHIANPIATPNTTTTYTLKVVYENFTAEITDQVTVYVDEINDFTITNKTCCFKPGTTLKVSDFNIVTDPPGLENQIYFEPSVVPEVLQQEHQYPILAKIKCDKEYTIVHSVNITVINENNLSSAQVSIGPISKGVEALGKIMDYLNDGVKQIPGNPCPFSITPTFNVFKQDGKLCCPDAGCVAEKQKLGGNLKLCGGTTCDIPIAGWPGIATFNAVLLANMCLAVQVDYTNKCDGGDLCLTGNIELNFGGGVSGTVLGGAAARVAGTLVNQINAPPFQICIPSGKVTILGPICYQLDAVLQIQFLSGLYGWQWKHPLIPKTCH